MKTAQEAFLYPEKQLLNLHIFPREGKPIPNVSGVEVEKLCSGVPLWLSGLRAQCCLCEDSG